MFHIDDALERDVSSNMTKYEAVIQQFIIALITNAFW
jgi:hypothetical protein